MEIDTKTIKALNRFGSELLATDDDRSKAAGTAILNIANEYPIIKKRAELLEQTFDMMITHMRVVGKIDAHQREIALNYVGVKLMEINIQSQIV